MCVSCVVKFVLTFPFPRMLEYKVVAKPFRLRVCEHVYVRACYLSPEL